MGQAHSRSRQSKVVEAAQSVLGSLGIDRTDSAPPSIQHYHHQHRDQYGSRRECYSDLGGRAWGREAKGRWSAKGVLWKIILKGLCRSVRRYTHQEIGERVLARAKALGLNEEQVATAGLKDLSARSVRYRLRKYGLNSLKTGPKNSPKSDTFSKEGSKKQTYILLHSKNQDRRSSIESTSTPSSPTTLKTELKVNSVSERFSPEKLEHGNPEKYWWGRLTPSSRFQRDLPYFQFKEGPWVVLVYGACHPGHTVRVDSKGEPLDIEVRAVIRRFSHYQNGRDLTLCTFWSHKPENGPFKKWKKVEQRDTVPRSWDQTYSTIGRDKVPEKSKMPVGTIWKDVSSPDMDIFRWESREAFMKAYHQYRKDLTTAAWEGYVLGEVQVGGLFYGWSRECSIDQSVMEVTEVIRRCRDRQGRKMLRVKARMSSTKIHSGDHVLFSASYCKPTGRPS